MGDQAYRVGEVALPAVLGPELEIGGPHFTERQGEHLQGPTQLEDHRMIGPVYNPALERDLDHVRE